MNDAALAAAFAALDAHAPTLRKISMREVFAADPQRFGQFSRRLDDLLFDFSKHAIVGETLKLLLALAEASGLEQRRAALFAGAVVNTTEKRPALHMALRNLRGTPYRAEGHDVTADVAAERAKMAAFANAIRSGKIVGAKGAPLSDIVNIGIGGSDLGPAMAARALSPYGKPGLTPHFVSNVDGADLADTLGGLDPSRTLFIISSKTFTTLETMTNAQSARDWISKALGEDAVGHHFAAVSTKLDLVQKFGIASDRVFGFWDWVGGRYSVWGAIGLALDIAIGPENFDAFLRGAEDVDTHFRDTPFDQNIPVLMALLAIWWRNIQGCQAQAVIPYDQRLGRFSAYLQQLEMESNGKSVRLDGTPVRHETAPVIWGEPGTNGQHAFFQMLHQGTTIVPIDFLVAAEPTDADPHHHDLLLANCFAQSEALMHGRTLAEATALLTKSGLDDPAAAALAPHKVFSGNRPTSTLLYRQLTPRTLGRLIALYEHKVFVQGTIWEINSFDQWGVELGKELASRLVPIVSDPQAATHDLDGSTAGLIAARRTLAS